MSTADSRVDENDGTAIGESCSEARARLEADARDQVSALARSRETSDAFPCRDGCGACCIAPSISTPFPGHPHGKPAGVRCAQLDERLRCKLFGKPERPAVCASLAAEPAMCGASREEALATLARWEIATRP